MTASSPCFLCDHAAQVKMWTTIGRRDGDEWVARAEVGTNLVTVEGSSFDPADVALVRIANIEPYVIGTRQFYERR